WVCDVIVIHDELSALRVCISFLCNFCSYFFFFFSSRRRHTRFSRDWSSDVCSSDLVELRARIAQAHGRRRVGVLVDGQGQKHRGHAQNQHVKPEIRNHHAAVPPPPFPSPTPVSSSRRPRRRPRSEEHTSELQSRENL